MIILKVPDGPHKGKGMPIPFLAFADEEIANEDAVLMPIIHEIMTEARNAQSKRS